ncbi:unnamed protein product, partial [Ectocarpus sp. 8 AP-2014]
TQNIYRCRTAESTPAHLGGAKAAVCKCAGLYLSPLVKTFTAEIALGDQQSICGRHIAGSNHPHRTPAAT